ncbi:ABC transporter permease subunit (plasmid) [Embleya sp. NBC_00888]|uniref:ABC transporter permease n=1 Tax=Embleya sp. NBC_00888 TaxID=2975960 RepID=UPI002F908C53|nr:ABC transporter permease subunit [Embleya sp. NBC_00888]
MTSVRISRGVLASEWIKLRSIRSTYLMIGLAAVVALGLGAFDYGNLVADWDGMTADERARFDPVRFGFSGGYYVVVLALGALGVLTTSSEYGSGLIRTTFAAVPRRRRVLAAKVLVTGGVTLAVGETIAFATFVVGRSILADKDLDVGLGDPHVLRAVVATGAFVAVMAVLGLAVGAIVRHSAGAVTALFGLFFVAPMVTAASDTARSWTLQSVFQALSTTTGPAQAGRPSTMMATVVCAVYLALALGTAGWLLERRDT